MAKKKNKKTALASNAFDQAIMSWYSPEFLRYERGFFWFLMLGLLDGALILYAVWTGSITMLLVFLVVPAVFLMEHLRKPKTVQVTISPYGIKFGNTKLAFSEIRRFWILHDPPYLNELHILTNKRLHPEVTIPLLNLDPTIIRNVLVTQVPEWEGKNESLLDTIIRVCKLA